MFRSTLMAALAALAVGIGSASAASAQDPVTAIVSYKDLNLATEDGARTLLRRIDQAARQVCKPDADIAELPGMGGWSRVCVTSRVREAVSHLNAPMVSAAYNGRSHDLLAERDSR